MSEPLPMTSTKDTAGTLRIGSAMRERCEEPPTFTELRDFFTQLLQRHFSNSADYGKHSEVMRCLTYNLDDPDKSELPVNMAFGDPDLPANSKGVRIFLQDFNFKSTQIGMVSGYSADNSTIYTAKGGVGSLLVSVSHENAEVAHMLAESIIPFLEGTRMVWMPLFHIDAFNVVSLAAVKRAIPKPEELFQANVVAQMQCRVITGLTEESLRLKKIALTTNLV